MCTKSLLHGHYVTQVALHKIYIESVTGLTSILAASAADSKLEIFKVMQFSLNLARVENFVKSVHHSLFLSECCQYQPIIYKEYCLKNYKRHEENETIFRRTTDSFIHIGQAGLCRQRTLYIIPPPSIISPRQNVQNLVSIDISNILKYH